MRSNINDFEYPEQPLILAHRGSQLIKKYPDNSLQAFREGLQLGADGIELDIRISADQNIMVFHDRTLLRLLGIKKELRKFSATQLQHFRFIHQTPLENIKIPTLREVFQEFGNQIYYNIEIKRISGSYITLIQKLYDILVEFQLWNKVWISSFDPRALWQWRRQYSSVPVALLLNRWRLWERWLCHQSFIDIFHHGINLIYKI
jgi:glycerophosphoryl diester phosphodiesterase